MDCKVWLGGTADLLRVRGFGRLPELAMVDRFELLRETLRRRKIPACE